MFDDFSLPISYQRALKLPEIHILVDFPNGSMMQI